MSNSWYPRYYGDFMRDTGHLSLIEVGAYNRLLDHYYATGKPLPDDKWQLLRVCHAVANDEQDAVVRICEQFFIKQDGLLRNKRADAEIEKLSLISAKRSESGRKGANARYGKRNGKRIASATTSTSTSTDTSTSTPTAKKDAYGEFEKVKLTTEQYKKLEIVYGTSLPKAIEILDTYIESKGAKYKSHYAVMKRGGWVYERATEGKSLKSRAPETMRDTRDTSLHNAMDALTHADESGGEDAVSRCLSVLNDKYRDQGKNGDGQTVATEAYEVWRFRNKEGV